MTSRLARLAATDSVGQTSGLPVQACSASSSVRQIGRRNFEHCQGIDEGSVTGGFEARRTLGCRASVWSARSLLPLSNNLEPRRSGGLERQSWAKKRQQAARTPYASRGSEA